MSASFLMLRMPVAQGFVTSAKTWKNVHCYFSYGVSSHCTSSVKGVHLQFTNKHPRPAQKQHCSSMEYAEPKINFTEKKSHYKQITEHSNIFLTSSTPGSPTTVHEPSSTEEALALIILNTNCCGNSFQRLWELSSFHLCADGGANRLYDFIPPQLREKFVPDVIKGDLDSLREDVQMYYENLGTIVTREKDQNCNDFFKCLTAVKLMAAEKCPQKKITVLALGAFGGRFDHEMAAINACFEWQPFAKIMLFSEENLGFLLPPGTHRIFPNHQIEGPTCGLLPIGSAVSSVTTRGLKWNLQNQTLKFGGLVSSSNRIVDPVVDITTSDPLLWMTQLRPDGWPRSIQSF